MALKTSVTALKITLLAILLIPVVSCSKKTIDGGSATNNNGGNTGGNGTTTTPVTTDVSMWLTNPDQSQLLAKQNVALTFSTATNNNTTINVDTTTTYQTIDGFGYALTGGSATLIDGLGANQSTFLNDIFSTAAGHVGSSFVRISIGASDMSAADFTYDDMPAGQTDTALANFSISQELTDLVPVLKKIIAINPSIKILATPWTAPAWMKVNSNGNNGFTAGSLNTAYYNVYARYFVKYIQAMAAQGITIYAVTPQNEPLNANNNPAMTMQATEEANFIKNNLGPQFAANNISTKIICYDHNCDQPGYPETVLGDAGANPYVDGSAFHLYAGDISALTTVHTAYPTKNVYFTEQYIGGPGNFAGDLLWHVDNLIIGAPRNWSRVVLEWNLASDPNYDPHTAGGCSTCLGAVTISGNSYTKNTAYYTVAHASEFVKAGAVRIASDASTALPNVAFKNPDGTKVLLVSNNSGATSTFNIKFNSKIITSTLAAGAVATYVW